MSHFELNLKSDSFDDIVSALALAMRHVGARHSVARSWYADPDTSELVLFWYENPSDFPNTKPFPQKFDNALAGAFVESYIRSLPKEAWGDMPDIDGSCYRGFRIVVNDYLRWGTLEEVRYSSGERHWHGTKRSAYAFLKIKLEWCEYHK